MTTKERGNLRPAPHLASVAHLDGAPLGAIHRKSFTRHPSVVPFPLARWQRERRTPEDEVAFRAGRPHQSRAPPPSAEQGPHQGPLLGALRTAETF
jgi:hypothetical protein